MAASLIGLLVTRGFRWRPVFGAALVAFVGTVAVASGCSRTSQRQRLVLVPMTAVKGRVSRVTRSLTFLVAALAVIALVLHLVGLSRESNGEMIAFALPPALALAWAVHRGTARPREAAI